MNPRIVEWTGFSFSPSSLVATQVADGAGVVYSASGATATSVVEGSLAWAAFKFVDPVLGTGASAPVPLPAQASLEFALTGVSAYDLAHGGQVLAYALDAAGEVQGPGQWVGAGNPPATWNAGVHGFVVAVPVRVDTAIETGENLKFQVFNYGQTAFTESYYLEQYIDITDRYTAATRPKVVVAGANMGNTTAQVPSAVVALLGETGPLVAGVAPFEGQWALGKFAFVNAATGNTVQNGGTSGLEYAIDLRVAYNGGSSADYVSGSFKVFATNEAGVVLGGGALPVVGGRVTVPATATDVVLAVRTAQDTQAEHSEQVVFQVNKVDADSFTDSHHVEQRMALKDFQNTFNVTAALPYSATATADAFVVTAAASHVYSGTAPAYATVVGYGAGDVLKVDVTEPYLSVVNFGTLAMNEAFLIAGLRNLNGVDCVSGAVYLIGARDNVNSMQTHTFVLVDSNNDGRLTMGTSVQPDVFIKLAGVSPNTFDDTDFVLF